MIKVVNRLDVKEAGLRSDRIGLRSVMRTIGVGSILVLAVILAMIVAPVCEHLEVAKADTVDSPVLTFVSTNATASVSLSVRDASGTFATSASNQKAAFSISTNNPIGYTVSIAATGSSTSLVNTDDSSKTLATLPGNTNSGITSATFDTAAYNNMWGYSPSSYRLNDNNIDNTDVDTALYFPAPTSSSARILAKTNIANSSDGVSNPDNYTIGLGLRADYSSQSGIYTNGTFLIRYVANMIEYLITFEDDVNDYVNHLPTALSGYTNSATVEIVNDSTPVRAGFDFSKWCLGSTSDNATACTGIEYEVGDFLSLDLDAVNHYVLNAVWIENDSGIVPPVNPSEPLVVNETDDVMDDGDSKKADDES